jgi:hypothetical protein
VSCRPLCRPGGRAAAWGHGRGCSPRRADRLDTEEAPTLDFGPCVGASFAHFPIVAVPPPFMKLFRMWRKPCLMVDR